MDNKKKYLIIGMFGIIFAFFGGTLAYYQWESSEESKTLVTFTVESDFKCAADGGGDITSSNVTLAPSTCTNSKYAIKREVLVKPTITKNNTVITMDLWLDIGNIGTGLSNSQNFKYALTTEPDSCTQGVIASGNFNGKDNTTNNTVNLLDSIGYSSTSTDKYYLYIWLDAKETSTSTMNQTFELSLNGSCTNNTSIENIDLNYKVTNLSNSTNNLDNGYYTLSSYTCDNNTTLTYDTASKTLTSSGIDKCNLQFTKTSNPTLYDTVEIGDYIAYTGDSTNGCTEPQCSGFNANQSESATGELDLYGYCDDDDYKFLTYGWRVLYKNDNSVYIVSAGAPECVKGTSSDSTATITSLNTAALKYCNTKYLSGGTCDETTAHPFKNSDFYNFTTQYFGTGYYLNSYRDGGTPHCYGSQAKNCGHGNDIIDNGGDYWFGSLYAYGVTLAWGARDRRVFGSSGTNAYGLRPVLKLDSSILATGGSGTMSDPYTISERTGQ